jgi:PBP1b-binding outer membrane lipoprotein LpoB
MNALDGKDIWTIWDRFSEVASALANRDSKDNPAPLYLDQVEALTALIAEAEHLRKVNGYLAVAEGASWSQVGAAAGISKQGAQQKWGKNHQGTTAEQAGALWHERRVAGHRSPSAASSA